MALLIYDVCRGTRGVQQGEQHPMGGEGEGTILTKMRIYIQHFVEHMKMGELEPGKVMASYDVKGLFNSVPMESSLAIVQCKLQQNPLLSQKTGMSIPKIVTLLEFCLKKTHFHFWGKY